MIEKPRRPEIVEPQLAAMIDVFSILIIFLIAGTVMGETAVFLPETVTPPKSVSKESMLTAPQLTIDRDQVSLSFVPKPFLLPALQSTLETNEEAVRFKNEVQIYLVKNQGRADVDVINFVADRNLTYDRIFSVIKLAREAGMKSILFVSTSEAAHD